MTFAIGLAVIGAILIYSALYDVTIADALQGKAPDTLPSDFLPGISASAGATPGGATGPMPKGMVKVDGKPVCAWVAAELDKARKRGWTGKVNSGYRNNQEQAQACVEVCGNPGGCGGSCAAPGESNHQGTAFPKCAVDVTNPAELSRILTSIGSPLKWAGAADPPHFSHPQGGSY